MWRTGSTGALTNLLAEDVAFFRRSGERESLSAFTGRVDVGKLQAILREERGPEGPPACYVRVLARCTRL